MSAERDAFHEWEQSGPFVHVMIIERGNGEPESRLTLTDRLYVDKGVDGVKYHHLYPAPIHCIISPLRVSMGIDRCSFDEIVLSNEGGRFDNLYSEDAIIGKPFRVLRGHPRWSLLEKHLPFMFIPIFAGVIESVNFRKKGGEVVLQIAPARYKMDNTIGSIEQPVCVGLRRNVPAVLVNASSLRYRFCINETREDNWFELRDKGVVLNEGADYTKVLEDGKFRSLVELTSPPAGQLTASIIGQMQNVTKNILTELGWITTQYLLEDYSLIQARQSMTVGEAGACCNPDRTKMYLASFVTNRIYQFSMSSEDPTTLTYDSKLSSPIQTSAFCLNQSGTRLWYYQSDGKLRTRTLSTPFDISTSVDDAPLKVLEISATDLALAPDESAVWLSTGAKIRKFLVSGDASTAVEDTDAEIDLSRFIVGRAYRFTFTDEGRGLVVYDSDAAQLRLFRLFTPYGHELLDIGQAYSTLEFDGASINVRALIESSNGSSLFVVDSSPEVIKLNLETELRPNTTLRNGFNGFDDPYSMGVFINQETAIGTVLTTLISGVIDGFVVDKLGGLRFVRMMHPSFSAGALTTEPVFQLHYRDFIGSNDYAQIVDLMEAVNKVTVNFNRNDQIQTPGDLATSLSVEEIEDYGREWYTGSMSAPTPNGQSDLVVDTSIGQNGSSLAFDILLLRGIPRKVYQLNTNLRWIGVAEPFSVGSVIEVGDDWHFPSLEPGNLLITTGVEIDYTRNTMTLRAYR